MSRLCKEMPLKDRVDLDRCDVFAVGDVHGDPHCLTETLSALRTPKGNRLVTVPESVAAAAGRCVCGPTEDLISDAGLDKIKVHCDRPTVLLMLGDVLDNRRGRDGSADGLHGCGTSTTQLLCMDILVAVHKRLAAAHKTGGVVWIVGNHCAANVLRFAENAQFCQKYAPAMSAEKTKGKKGTTMTHFPTCSIATGYSDKHARAVLKRMGAVTTVAMLPLVSKDVTVLAVHGYMCQSSAVNLARFVPGVDKMDFLSACSAINAFFAPLWDIREFDRQSAKWEAARAPLREAPECTPFWCRPAKGSKAAFAGTAPTVVLKGHDVVKRPNQHTKQIDGQTVHFLDCGASAEFYKDHETVGRLRWASWNGGRFQVNEHSRTMVYGPVAHAAACKSRA